MNEQTPYLTKTTVCYNPHYGDDRICKCGHSYTRHFDSYENNEPVGCKYCACHTFVEGNLDCRVLYLSKDDVTLTSLPISVVFIDNTMAGVILPTEYVKELGHAGLQLSHIVRENPALEHQLSLVESFLKICEELRAVEIAMRQS
jgi:hypothetical protein